ncbi:MAG: hypothetical protein LBU97_03390 [Alistipes sp.]|nr:hypothetical protein [Alistipes sp.]
MSYISSTRSAGTGGGGGGVGLGQPTSNTEESITAASLTGNFADNFAGSADSLTGSAVANAVKVYRFIFRTIISNFIWEIR